MKSKSYKNLCLSFKDISFSIYFYQITNFTKKRNFYIFIKLLINVYINIFKNLFKNALAKKKRVQCKFG